MKAKVSRGGGFRGALLYVHEKGDAEKVGGNMAGQTVDELVQEFAVTRKLRPDCTKPVWHCSLGLPAGERASAETWGEIARDFMLEMGMDPDNFLYDVRRHSDTDYDHAHIVASRIGLDGSLWHGAKDVFTAIEATQRLEKKHGLTLTPGFDPEHKKDRASLKAEEINMGIRRETKPPKLVCQDAIDQVLKQSPALTAPEFIKALDLLGVRAIPNIASTGTMNGFSFEAEGISFTGSKLGESFKWAQLQKRGIEYVKDRDFEDLTNTRRLAGQRAADTASARPEQPAPGFGDQSSAGVEPVARPDHRTSDHSVSTAGNDAPGLSFNNASVRSSDSSAADDIGRVSAGDQQQSNGADGSENQSARRVDSVADSQHGQDVFGHQGVDGSTFREDGDDRSAAREAESRPSFIVQRPENGVKTANSSSKRAENPNRSGQVESVESVGPVNGGGAGQRSHNANWASRFKLANATKSAAAKHRSDELFSQKAAYANRTEARSIDPTDYLKSQGYAVIKQGRHLSVQMHGDEIYRVTQKTDGHWVTCDKYENGIGDNIALVQEIEPGTIFSEAVYKLSGSPSVMAMQPVAARKPPTLPIQNNEDIKKGRDYLINRGISLNTIEYAEKTGMLRYAAGSVFFVGRDESGTAQNVTRRAIDPADPMQKRDLFGTDKRHPQVLLGSTDTVFIVEGGADALAAHDIARREKRQPPTVLVSGGANSRGFMQTHWVQKIISAAKKIIVAFEREDSPEKQLKTDHAHNEQINALRDICNSEIISWKPPENVKDMAELNIIQVQRAALEAAKAAKQHYVRER